MDDAPNPRTGSEKDDKAARRAAALRANLGRRKAQKRTRGAAPDDDANGAADETAEQER